MNEVKSFCSSSMQATSKYDAMVDEKTLCSNDFADCHRSCYLLQVAKELFGNILLTKETLISTFFFPNFHCSLIESAEKKMWKFFV